MKLKIKLPLLFMMVFVLIIFPGAVFIKNFITEKPKILRLPLVPIQLEVVFYLLILTGLVFVVLAVYLHFNITKPLQFLNTRLKRVNMSRPVTLSSKRTDEIGELYNHFNEMEARLYQAHKEQIGMIAAMAHDLKTPLTTINGFVELLAMQKNLSEKEIQEYYELILKKTKHIAELINTFSSYTKGEVELDTLDMKSVEAHKLFASIATEYETELSGFDFELDWENHFKVNHHIMIDEHMIRRVFGNLCSNAVRYAERKDLKVYMRGYVRGKYAFFQVEDNGLGVPDKELPLLFQKFFTVDKSRQNKNGGMGLGLASCKSIIEHHGGEISAFPSNYGGLGIRFALPLVK